MVIKYSNYKPNKLYKINKTGHLNQVTGELGKGGHFRCHLQYPFY